VASLPLRCESYPFEPLLNVWLLQDNELGSASISSTLLNPKFFGPECTFFLG
jgi:hypothetical protein